MNEIFVRSRIVSLFFCIRRCVIVILNLSGIFVKFKKTSKTAVVLIAGVTISGTPCPRHITVPFGAEAPSSHVAQACVKFKKPSKTAVVLIAGVTISSTLCPRHITVPFGAEALSGHVAQT